MLTAVFILSGYGTFAQGLELAGFSFTRFPGAQVVDSPINQEIEVNEYNFFLNIPKPLKNEKTVIVNGLQNKLVTPFAENDIAVGIDGENLHLIGYRLMVLHQLKNDWRLLALVNPALSSTFSTSLDSDDFLLNGTLQFIKQKTEKLSYGGGLLFTSRFGNPILLPTLQLTLKTEKSQFKMVLPRSISYERYFGDFTAGLEASVDGSLYNVNYAIDTGGSLAEPVDKVGYTRVIVGPKLSYRIGEVLKLNASGGIAAVRRLELQSDFFENLTNEVEASTFLQLGISIVPPKKN